MAQVKVSLNLPDEVVEAAKELAEKRGTTFTEVIRDAISTEYYLDNERGNGSSICIGKPDGKMVELSFPSDRDLATRK